MGQSHLLAVIMKIHGSVSEHRLIIKALLWHFAGEIR